MDIYQWEKSSDINVLYSMSLTNMYTNGEVVNFISNAEVSHHSKYRLPQHW